MAPNKRSAAAALSQSKGNKQSTLFSFFSKLPAKKKEAPPDPPAPKTAPTPQATKARPEDACSQVRVGTRVAVYWPDDDTYYDATVSKIRSVRPRFSLRYDDGQCEWVNLEEETFRLLEGKPPANKRRRILEDSEEEEFEMDDASESEGSAYVEDKAAALEDDDDDEEEEEAQWMVTDDEEEASTKKKKPAKKINSTPRVTETKFPAKTSRTPRKSPASRNSITTLTPNTKPTMGTTKNTVTPLERRITPSPTVHSDSNEPPMYEKGSVVNPAGSHVHNHLKFLRNPRDSQGRTRDHPDYDPRTLRVDHAEWDRHCGKMTAAAKQWWDMKSQYFDAILLFKTGKFYELYHMDADAGVTVCGHNYMKGHIAHSGFPEAAYGHMTDKLVRAGYKVVRVEQTETPAMLKERRKKTKGLPNTVNREVCSITTLGTRTFCYLDSEEALCLNESSSTHAVGPLLAIREVLVDEMDTDGGDGGIQPICEYGVTLVDAVRGVVTIGQFADDVLRSRMTTLLATFGPCEILVEGGKNGASPTLLSLIKSVQNSSTSPIRVETIQPTETFPKSTAVDEEVRRKLERKTSSIQPWDPAQTLSELHRRGYYPRSSRKQQDTDNTSRWPKVLRAVVEGNAELAISSFGAALFYLQRSMIDEEILSMGIVKAYIPPSTSVEAVSPNALDEAVSDQNLKEACLDIEFPDETAPPGEANEGPSSHDFGESNGEEEITHMSLDGTTLHNLEILTNSIDHKVAGSLWSKINHTKTPHGGRLLRAWLLRPLFRKADIDRRADAVEELVSGSAAVALSEAASVLSKCGDIERLLSRVHSMSGTAQPDGEEGSRHHPNERAILYETQMYTKRKVGDFSRVMNGLRHASRIPAIFAGIEFNSGFLHKIVRHTDEGGCFPRMEEELDWFFDNFDFDQAAKGLFEPTAGVNEAYDEASATVEKILSDLQDYKDEMCSVLTPRHVVKSSWKYINTKPESKDKYLIELPASVAVPDDFIVKGKRGSGHKQVNKYRAAGVEKLVKELEIALETQKERKARFMESFFAKFDSRRNIWAAASHAVAVLDALGALARTATKSGYSRPTILECPPNGRPCIRVVQGRHPCVETTNSCSDFVPNNLDLGKETETGVSRMLLLSGPNMGGKSTLLRQTCLIAIMAQIGCYVPAESCELTPVDRIYTRLGASDRILLGHSTFYVELAETAAALRGATRRSLVIMDELGRGTSTFDGTAIASATVRHLVDRSKCLCLFATHYYALLEEWRNSPNVRLGHMECILDEDESTEGADNNITFLYTLGDGACPKSFGINVARLASLPEEVLAKAKQISSDFEAAMNRGPSSVSSLRREIEAAIRLSDWDRVESLWQELR